MFKKFFLIFFLIFQIYSKLEAQNFPIEVSQYEFINYDKNYLEFYGDSSNFEKLYTKIDSLLFLGEGQITIVQIGASHTQADVFSAQVRKRFQNFDYGNNAGRGYVFPYKMMNTNNPYDYYTKHTGNWIVSRNVDGNNTLLGLTGISSTTYDSTATFSVFLRNNDTEIQHSFNRIKLIHTSDTLNFIPTLDLDTALFTRIINFDKGYTEFFLDNYYTKVDFILEKKSPTQNYFSLFGIFLENDEPGFIYHPMGINGASTKSVLQCSFFEQHLKIVNPDLIIIDLGTNDGYTSKFDSVAYETNYTTIIEKIKSVNSDIAIVAFVPNDCYLYKKRANPATATQERILKRISEKQNIAVWNKYEIMGGFNSSLTWYKNLLMTYDRVHFTNAGYQLLGDMFFNAFINSYNFHLEKI